MLKIPERPVMDFTQLAKSGIGCELQYPADYRCLTHRWNSAYIEKESLVYAKQRKYKD